MTPLSEMIFSRGGITLSVIGMLLLLGQILLVIHVFTHRRGIAVRASAAVQLLCGAGWFCLFLDGNFDPDYFERARDFFPVTEWMYRSPWLVVAGIEAVFAVLLIVSMIADRRYRRQNVSQSAIKETVDMLPVGICFSKEDGTVVLKNLLADALCGELTGKPLNDAAAFWERVEEAGERQDQSTIVSLPSGRAILCQRSGITVDGTPYIQMIAGDITEQYQITAELREKNQKLTEMQARMKSYGAMATRLAMTQEVLRARVSIHDEMGHLLLSGKYYLDRPDIADREKLLEMERYTHLLLMREGEEPDDAQHDGFEDALAAAHAMGVTVTVSGDPPETEPQRRLLGQAIRECAANTVKHAAGDSMTVRIVGGDQLSVVLKGNGASPIGTITEAGGLLNLRRSIESAGGKLTITYEPQVTLTVVLS